MSSLPGNRCSRNARRGAHKPLGQRNFLCRCGQTTINWRRRAASQEEHRTSTTGALTVLQTGPTWPLMYEPVYGGGAVARPGSIEGGRQITVTAHDQIERAVEEMRAQFLTISGQIADELTRLTQHVATASPSVRERVVNAALQIVSTQHFLRAESERLPSDPHERYNIMESVLQAQQGALHQLAIIVMQHAPGWYPNLAHTAAWHSTVSNAAPPWSPPPTPGGEVNGSSNPAPSYPSPPTVQDLATHGWPQAPGNGYPHRCAAATPPVPVANGEHGDGGPLSQPRADPRRRCTRRGRAVGAMRRAQANMSPGSCVPSARLPRVVRNCRRRESGPRWSPTNPGRTTCCGLASSPWR